MDRTKAIRWCKDRCVAFLVLMSASWIVLFCPASWAQGPPAAAVVVARVEQAKVRATVKVVGTIVPRTESTVSSEIPGLVKLLPVRQGDRVKVGDVICKLKDDTLRLLLAEAEAGLAGLKETLAELEVGTRKEDLDRLRAVVEEAKAIENKWDREKKRVEGLYGKKVASAQEYNDTISDWIAAVQRLAQTQAELAKAVAGPRKEQIGRARAQVRAQQAVVDQIKDRIDKSSIRAPYSGYIIAKRTEVGQWVIEGGPVVEMLALDRVLARVDIPEKAIIFARQGDAARVWIDALGNDFTGKVVHVIPRGDPEARTFPVEIELVNDRQMIKPGMFVRATLSAGPEITSLIVPKDAIVRQGPIRMVYAVRGGRALPVVVQMGLALKEKISITGQIKPGEIVVVRGNQRLIPGQPVIINNAAELNLPSGPDMPKGKADPAGTAKK